MYAETPESFGALHAHGGLNCASIPRMTKAVVICVLMLRGCLGAARVLRHHYFSFLTAGILAGIAIAAATSTSFEEKADPDSGADYEDEARWAVPQKQSFSTRGRALIYYLVESEEQASAIHQAMRGDMVASELNGGRYDFGLVYYLVARTAVQEANVARLLNTIVESTAVGGVVVTVIDLRP